MGCTVTTNRHGVLTFRIFWQGGEYWRSTGRKDTPEDRRYVDALAEVIREAIKKKTFSLDWFEDEAKRQKPDSKTVGGYYLEWIERKKPPLSELDLREITEIILTATYWESSKPWRWSMSPRGAWKSFEPIC